MKDEGGIVFLKKLLYASALLFSFNVFADSINLSDLERVPKKIKSFPISESWDSKKEELLVRQENRLTGKGMKRSFYTGTLFSYKFKSWNIPLLNNWYLQSVETAGCFKPAILTMAKFKTTRKEQLGFMVWPDSKECILQDKVPQIYNVVYLNGKYLAITTNVNIFIFDMGKGKFLQDYLFTGGKVVQFYITEDKQIAVKANKDGAYDGTLRYFKNLNESLYLELKEDELYFLEKLMIFYSDEENLTTPAKWAIKDFDKFKLNKD